MMSAARDVKAVAQVIQRITSEGIQTTGMLESTVPFQVGQQQTVQLGCLLQATAVEGGVVGHQRIELVQVGTLDFLPYLLEVGSVFRVFRTDSMYLYVPVMIEIVFRLDQPGTCLRDFSVPYDADTTSQMEDRLALAVSKSMAIKFSGFIGLLVVILCWLFPVDGAG